MSKPSAPPTPDYAALAKQQGAANKETAITEFSLNNSNQTSPWGGRNLTQTGTDAQGNPKFSIDTFLDPQDQSNLDANRSLQGQLLGVAPSVLNTVSNSLSQPINPNLMPPMVNQVDTGGLQQLDLSGLNKSTTGVNGAPIQSGLDYSGLAPLENADAVRNRVEQADFSKFYDRFAPIAQTQQDQMNTRIANMGGVTTSDAAQRMMGGLLTNQGDQLRQGIYGAIDNAGVEAQRQFDMGLQGRQQGVQEVGNQGAFYNNAQEQGFNQGMQNANLNNAARTADAGILGSQNQANNATTQQNITNAFANANLNNASRSQGLSEQTALRQMPLNELMSMLSGTQVNQPQFQAPTATNIQPAPIFQAGQAQWNAANQAYQGQVAGSNNTMSTIGSVAAIAAMAF